MNMTPMTTKHNALMFVAAATMTIVGGIAATSAAAPRRARTRARTRARMRAPWRAGARTIGLKIGNVRNKSQAARCTMLRSRHRRKKKKKNFLALRSGCFPEFGTPMMRKVQGRFGFPARLGFEYWVPRDTPPVFGCTTRYLQWSARPFGTTSNRREEELGVYDDFLERKKEKKPTKPLGPQVLLIPTHPSPKHLSGVMGVGTVALLKTLIKMGVCILRPYSLC